MICPLNLTRVTSPKLTHHLLSPLASFRPSLFDRSLEVNPLSPETGVRLDRVYFEGGKEIPKDRRKENIKYEYHVSILLYMRMTRKSRQFRQFEPVGRPVYETGTYSQRGSERGEEYRKKDEDRKVDIRKLRRGTKRGVTERDNDENCERRTQGNTARMRGGSGGGRRGGDEKER